MRLSSLFHCPCAAQVSQLRWGSRGRKCSRALPPYPCRQELGRAKGMYETMQLAFPRAYTEACDVGAKLAASFTEAMFLTALSNTQVGPAKMRERLETAKSKLKSYSTCFQRDVESLLLPVFFKESMSWLLSN